MSDTNRVKLTAFEESVWAVNPADPNLQALRFTSHTFGHRKDTRESATIRSDAQREFVAEVAARADGDLNAEFAFGPKEHDLFLRGALRSAFVEADTGDTTLTIDKAGAPAGQAFVDRAAGSFVTDGFLANRWARLDGFTNAVNNRAARLITVAATRLTVADPADEMVADTPGSGDEQVFMRTIRNATTLRSYVIEGTHLDLVSTIYQLRGMRVGGMRVNGSSQEIVGLTWSFNGKQADATGATILGAGSEQSTDATRAINSSGDVGAIEYNGAALTTGVRSVEFGIGNNARNIPELMNKFPRGIGYGFLDVTGTLEAYFESLTLWQDFINHTERSLLLRFTDFDGNDMIYTFPRILTVDGSPEVGGGNDDVVVSLAFRAVRDLTDNYTIQVDMLPRGADLP